MTASVLTNQNHYSLEERIKPHGARIFPFFFEGAFIKAANICGVPLSKCETVIFSGTKAMTDAAIFNAGRVVNFLTVLDNRNDLSIYENHEKNVFRETGLNITFRRFDKETVSRAHIIVNLPSSKTGGIFDLYYQKNAVIFDLTNDTAAKNELIWKKRGVKIVDSLRISIHGEKIPLNVFEAAFFIKSEQYQRVNLEGISSDYSDALQVLRQLKNLKARVFSLTYA
ncbi:MAG: hypothetical protein LBM16_01580 [Clostridiales bacterium]|jgi:hypothetical protein|nr:hypothetical protein [Clostridiales bacterium]